MAHPMQHYGKREPMKKSKLDCSQCGERFDPKWTHYRIIGGDVYCDSCEAEFFGDGTV